MSQGAGTDSLSPMGWVGVHTALSPERPGARPMSPRLYTTRGMRSQRSVHRLRTLRPFCSDFQTSGKFACKKKQTPSTLKFIFSTILPFSCGLVGLSMLLLFVWCYGSVLAYATLLSVAAVLYFRTKTIPTLPPP